MEIAAAVLHAKNGIQQKRKHPKRERKKTSFKSGKLTREILIRKIFQESFNQGVKLLPKTTAKVLVARLSRLSCLD